MTNGRNMLVAVLVTAVAIGASAAIQAQERPGAAPPDKEVRKPADRDQARAKPAPEAARRITEQLRRQDAKLEGLVQELNKLRDEVARLRARQAERPRTERPRTERERTERERTERPRAKGPVSPEAKRRGPECESGCDQRDKDRGKGRKMQRLRDKMKMRAQPNRPPRPGATPERGRADQFERREELRRRLEQNPELREHLRRRLQERHDRAESGRRELA